MNIFLASGLIEVILGTMKAFKFIIIHEAI